MNYANIKPCDIANGVGVRTSLFVSGCTRHCKDCFNQEAQDFNYGLPFTEDVEDMIILTLKPDYVDGLTVLGGEPFEPANQEAVLHLLKRVRKELPSKSIWCYTGNVLERDIINPKGGAHTDYSDELLKYIDVLVDGPFISELKNISLRFRGSENQRLINLPETLKQNKVVLWNDGLGKEEIIEGE